MWKEAIMMVNHNINFGGGTLIHEYVFNPRNKLYQKIIKFFVPFTVLWLQIMQT